MDAEGAVAAGALALVGLLSLLGELGGADDAVTAVLVHPLAELDVSVVLEHDLELVVLGDVAGVVDAGACGHHRDAKGVHEGAVVAVTGNLHRGDVGIVILDEVEVIGVVVEGGDIILAERGEDILARPENAAAVCGRDTDLAEGLVLVLVGLKPTNL